MRTIETCTQRGERDREEEEEGGTKGKEGDEEQEACTEWQNALT